MCTLILLLDIFLTVFFSMGRMKNYNGIQSTTPKFIFLKNVILLKIFSIFVGSAVDKKEMECTNRCVCRLRQSEGRKGFAILSCLTISAKRKNNVDRLDKLVQAGRKEETIILILLYTHILCCLPAIYSYRPDRKLLCLGRLVPHLLENFLCLFIDSDWR